MVYNVKTCPVVKIQKLLCSYVYILESIKNGMLYIGRTRDLRKRFGKHNSGLNFSTKHDKPWKLIYYEACLNSEDAKRRERYFKTTSGRRAFKLRLREYFYHK